MGKSHPHPRFLQLVDEKYYDECRIYRVIPGFICQWGIPADPAQFRKWGENKIKDDPVKTSNTRGKISFVKCLRGTMSESMSGTRPLPL